MFNDLLMPNITLSLLTFLSNNSELIFQIISIGSFVSFIILFSIIAQNIPIYFESSQAGNIIGKVGTAILTGVAAGATKSLVDNALKDKDVKTPNNGDTKTTGSDNSVSEPSKDSAK